MVPARLCFFQYSRKVRMNRPFWILCSLEPVKLGMVLVSFCLAFKHMLCEQSLAPQCNKAFLVEVGRVDAPKPHEEYHTRMHIQELGHVVLYVTNLAQSADFYRNTLGFNEIHRDRATALFGSARTHHELLLIEIGGAVREKHFPEPGLYHIGFKIGDSPEDLKAAHRELKEKGVPMAGASDHGVTHSLYIFDPDGNELELYADVSDAWKTDPKAVLAPIRPLDLS